MSEISAVQDDESRTPEYRDVNPYGFGLDMDFGRTLSMYGFKVNEAIDDKLVRCVWAHGSIGPSFVISRHTDIVTLQALLQYANDRFVEGVEDGKTTVRRVLRTALGLENND